MAGAEVFGADTRIAKGGGVVAETQRANDAQALRYVGAALGDGREKQMITVRIRERRADGGQTVWKVTAPTIRKALAAVPGDVLFPLRPEEFFAGAKVSAAKTGLDREGTYRQKYSPDDPIATSNVGAGVA
jgi:hypothetical protein